MSTSLPDTNICSFNFVFSWILLSSCSFNSCNCSSYFFSEALCFLNQSMWKFTFSSLNSFAVFFRSAFFSCRCIWTDLNYMSVRDIGLHLQSSSEIVHFHLEVGLLTVLPHLNYVATPHFVLILRLRLAFELKLPNFGGRKHRSVISSVRFLQSSMPKNKIPKQFESSTPQGSCFIFCNLHWRAANLSSWRKSGRF